MSQLLIQHYLNDLADLRRVSGEARESIVSEAFKTLLKDWARTKDLIFIPQYKIDTGTKERRYVDGALVYSGLRLPFGYWEAKDEKGNLDDEVETKFRRSYRYRYGDDGKRIDNISDWALEQFKARYAIENKAARPITKDGIFHYVYGALHDPIYREKYAQNLKREFPRIPFYTDFWRWAEWDEKLMVLHTGYAMIKPWPLERVNVPDEKSRKAGLAPKIALKADTESGNIRLDSETQLTGVPPEAWSYKLGNRSAVEWILDQYKEKTPKDPTIREKFNTYHFADHKEKVIDLLERVTRVSVETMKIVEAMRAEKR